MFAQLVPVAVSFEVSDFQDCFPFRVNLEDGCGLDAWGGSMNIGWGACGGGMNDVPSCFTLGGGCDLGGGEGGGWGGGGWGLRLGDYGGRGHPSS